MGSRGCQPHNQLYDDRTCKIRESLDEPQVVVSLNEEAMTQHVSEGGKDAVQQWNTVTDTNRCPNTQLTSDTAHKSDSHTNASHRLNYMLNSSLLGNMELMEISIYSGSCYSAPSRELSIESTVDPTCVSRTCSRLSNNGLHSGRRQIPYLSALILRAMDIPSSGE